MTQITRELAGNHHREYQQLFEHLLVAKNGFLLHCSAGKDRTGFGAALILAALGVDEKTIMQDYLLTNEAACLHEFMHTRMRDQYGEQRQNSVPVPARHPQVPVVRIGYSFRNRRH